MQPCIYNEMISDVVLFTTSQYRAITINKETAIKVVILLLYTRYIGCRHTEVNDIATYGIRIEDMIRQNNRHYSWLQKLLKSR